MSKAEFDKEVIKDVQRYFKKIGDAMGELEAEGGNLNSIAMMEALYLALTAAYASTLEVAKRGKNKKFLIEASIMVTEHGKGVHESAIRLSKAAMSDSC